MTKKSRKEFLETLRDAEKTGLKSFNGFMTPALTNHNPASYWHLETAGINVPSWSNVYPGERCVAKPVAETSRTEPFITEEGGRRVFYQEFIENWGTDYKLYVSGEIDYNVTLLEAASKIMEDRPGRERIKPDDELVELGKNIADVFGSRMLGVDVIEKDGYPVLDINAAPSYRRYR